MPGGDADEVGVGAVEVHEIDRADRGQRIDCGAQLVLDGAVRAGPQPEPKIQIRGLVLGAAGKRPEHEQVHTARGKARGDPAQGIPHGRVQAIRAGRSVRHAGIVKRPT